MEKMQESRKWKNKNKEEGKRTYRRLNNELIRETDQARERWWENECNELQKLDRRARPDLMYAKDGKPQNEEMGIKLELDVDEDSKGPVILYTVVKLQMQLKH